VVIVKLLGGLGNQMFQYAFGKKMALKNNCDLKLDLSFYQEQNARRYELDHFNITPAIATSPEVEALKQKQVRQENLRFKFLFKPRPYFIHEKNLAFNPAYFNTRDQVYIDGYWQSEKYFIDAAPQIREDFRFATPPSNNNRLMLSQIESCNAVSIHIRRGDFLAAEFIEIHGLCSVEYYNDAVDIMAKKIEKPVFFVFSDNIPWAKQNIKTNQEICFVDINDDHSAFEDLRLMSACKHHIIANSSFSWWGAWLNAGENKLVIAPKKWFANEDMNKASSSIVPENWIRI